MRQLFLLYGLLTLTEGQAGPISYMTSVVTECRTEISKTSSDVRTINTEGPREPGMVQCTAPYGFTVSLEARTVCGLRPLTMSMISPSNSSTYANKTASNFGHHQASGVGIAAISSSCGHRRRLGALGTTQHEWTYADTPDRHMDHGHTAQAEQPGTTDASGFSPEPTRQIETPSLPIVITWTAPESTQPRRTSASVGCPRAQRVLYTTSKAVFLHMTSTPSTLDDSTFPTAYSSNTGNSGPFAANTTDAFRSGADAARHPWVIKVIA